ncbi:hypothetical protein B0T11DRAFT_23722 [Plectosphaerella cucumerina]|uniref:Arca-like protein n=1 Tax=Plectosphaerella cucumerina TaxID=40658 RepID=A0A8K0TQP2_9PEZI|nr:hypothetical protein B0T11DRAFT_23722 [Plectosphaerella cucumerina]
MDEEKPEQEQLSAVRDLVEPRRDVGHRANSSASRTPAADLVRHHHQILESDQGHHDHHVRPSEEDDHAAYAYDDSVKANIYLEKPVWPIERRDEAILFRHYIQKLAIWLDLCDPLTHFQSSVPTRAGTCPILLNAIFALSARHLAHTARYDTLASNRYHEQCLTYLIPLLDHAVTVSDENLFAATIILRVLEEMDVPNLGQDTHGHLLGIHAFVAALPSRQPTPASGPASAPGSHSPSPMPLPQPPPARRRRILPNSLHAACFWVGLRQEIYSAVMNQQAVRMNLAHDGIVDRSTAPADDFTWANRAVVHCADVLNYCFGDTAAATAGPGAADAARRWALLSRANRDWKAALPPSYMPVFYRDRLRDDSRHTADDDGNGSPVAGIAAAFPEVWYTKACHVIAVQHHILAELYLALFDPSHPRTGLQRRSAEAALAAQARELVRNLCGIGVCNQWCPPAMFTACMGIAAAGDRFDDRREQDELLEVLRITELEHGRPTTAVRAQLRRCWGWE